MPRPGSCHADMRTGPLLASPSTQSLSGASTRQHPQAPQLPSLQVFSDDEDLVRDTTAVQLAGGRDIQGIPWELTQYTREGYRVRPVLWDPALSCASVASLPACNPPTPRRS